MPQDGYRDQRLSSEKRSVPDGQGGQTTTYSKSLTDNAAGSRTSRTKDGVTTSCADNARHPLVGSTTGGVTTAYGYERNGSLLQSFAGNAFTTICDRSPRSDGVSPRDRRGHL